MEAYDTAVHSPSKLSVPQSSLVYGFGLDSPTEYCYLLTNEWSYKLNLKETIHTVSQVP